jgi:hypothetical protein
VTIDGALPGSIDPHGQTDLHTCSIQKHLNSNTVSSRSNQDDQDESMKSEKNIGDKLSLSVIISECTKMIYEKDEMDKERWIEWNLHQW